MVRLRQHFWEILITALLISGLFASCYPLKHSSNIVAIERKGRPVAVNGEIIKKPSSTDAYQQQISHLKDSLTRVIQQGKVDTVLLYLHGGLVDLRGPIGIKRSERILDSISNHSPSTFPLFLNWESGFGSCYREHLFKVRQGHVLTDVEGVFSAPFVFTYDLFRALARYPRNVMYQAAHDFKDLEWLSWRTRNAHAVRDTLLQLSTDSSFTIVYGDDTRSCTRKAGALAVHAVAFPVKYTIGLVALEWLGVNAWANMQRRTTMLFRPQYEFGRSYSKKKDVVIGSAPQGVAVPFFELLEHVKQVDSNVVVNVVGHSMGAIVACEAFQTLPNLRVNNVVFMAAACSFSDIERSIIPALSKNQNMRFYNLTLNPEAEARELTIGSLLEQIDNFYEPISHFRDRTFGKYENAMCTVHVIPESLRNRVTIKSFPFDKGYPKEHDGFVYKPIRFWLPTFWR